MSNLWNGNHNFGRQNDNDNNTDNNNNTNSNNSNDIDIDSNNDSNSGSNNNTNDKEASSYRTSTSNPLSSNRNYKIHRRGVQIDSSDSSISQSKALKESPFKFPKKFKDSPVVSLKTRRNNVQRVEIGNRIESNADSDPIACSSSSDQSVAKRVNKQREVRLLDEDDDNRDGFEQIVSRHGSVNNLHNLCSSMATINELMRAKSFLFGTSVEEASKCDSKGKTVLHMFSNNKALSAIVGNRNNLDYETKDFLTLFSQPSIDKDSSEQLNKLVERFLVDDLLRSFFGAPIIEDNDGRIPFEAGLIDWIESCQKEVHDSHDDGGYFSAYTHRVSGAVTQAWESTSSTLMSAMAFGAKTDSKMSEHHVQGISHNDIEKMETQSTGSSSSSCRSLEKSSKITPHARFCLRMLSLILEELDKLVDPFKNGGVDHYIRFSQEICSPSDICTRVVEKIASIPNLIEVIFFINNEIDLEFSLSTKIIRRVLIHKNSVGNWLTTMLQSPQLQISQRAIDYLHIVSSLCSSKRNEQKRFGGQSHSENVKHDDFIDEVARLSDLIPSLLALGDEVIEEVSTTLIIKKVLDKMIARPFVATVVLCDAIFLILMIVGFRAAVNGMILGNDLDSILKWIYVANTGIFYFIISEIGKFVSLFLLSKHSRNYILSFWNLIDVLAVLFAAVSSVTMRCQFHGNGIENANFLRGLLAITTGFLWLRVLNFLKAINMQLATFVLAILQITKDIFWFCVILVILVVTFSQMFYTLLAPPSCAKGIENEQMACQQSEYILKVYTILLGDFGYFVREDFATSFSVFLVVFYSFFVTVVLLNVLIAIASDSYEKCLLKSQKLFGRARVMLIAELALFQTLLRRQDHDDTPHTATEGIVYSKWWTSSGLTRNWSRGSVLFFVLSAIVMICWAFAELFGFLKGEQAASLLLSLSSVFVNIVLYVTIMVFLDRNSATKNNPLDRNNEWSNSLQKMVLWILGVSRRATKQSNRSMKRDDAWYGRVEFLQREMDRISDKQTEAVMAQSDNLQSLMSASEIRVRTEINQVENRFKILETSVYDEQKETRKLNSKISLAVEELRSIMLSTNTSNGSSIEI